MTTGSFNPVEKRGNRKNKPVLDDNSPLLPTKQDKDEEVNEFNGASIAGAVFNLSTTIVGAGIMALPATMKVLGIIPGLLMIIFGAFLTQASIEMLIRSSRVGKATSYGEVMCDAFGKIGQTLLQVCVIVNNVGVMTVYMIIIGMIYLMSFLMCSL